VVQGKSFGAELNGLEGLLPLIEQRQGGETGVRAYNSSKAKTSGGPATKGFGPGRFWPPRSRAPTRPRAIRSRMAALRTLSASASCRSWPPRLALAARTHRRSALGHSRVGWRGGRYQRRRANARWRHLLRATLPPAATRRAPFQPAGRGDGRILSQWQIALAAAAQFF